MVGSPRSVAGRLRGDRGALVPSGVVAMRGRGAAVRLQRVEVRGGGGGVRAPRAFGRFLGTVRGLGAVLR
jgi:hypothetical protein